MSDIDFQNGLIVGITLAGKNGLIAPSIIESEGLLNQPSYTQNYDPSRYMDVYEKLNPQDGLSTPQYSYVIS